MVCNSPAPTCADWVNCTPARESIPSSWVTYSGRSWGSIAQSSIRSNDLTSPGLELLMPPSARRSVQIFSASSPNHSGQA